MVWATLAIGHMGNGAHGQWGSWAMGPMGDLNIQLNCMYTIKWYGPHWQ